MRTNRKLERPRELVFETTMRMIAESGYADLSLAKVARAIETSPSHLLYYFGTKESLFVQTLRWSEAAFPERIDEIVAARVSGRTQLRRFVDLYLPDGDTDPRWLLWLELWPRASRSEPVRDAQRASDAVWRRGLEAILRQCAPDGMSEREVQALAVRTLAMLDGYAVGLLTGSPGLTRASARRDAEALAGLA